MASGDYRRQWHKYLPLAVLNYNTTYHATREPSRIFHGRIPYNILDHKLGLNPNPKVLPTTDFADEFQRRTQIILDNTKKNIMQSYLKYKEYYDRKAKAALLKQNDYCFILQPIADHQGSKIPFWEYRWTGPYIVEKVLPNENYIVRKLNSNKTQILHRIRLRKYEPNTVLQDIRPEGNLQPDDGIVIPQDDLYVITWETEFGDFPAPSLQDEVSPDSAHDPSGHRDQILTDVDLGSTRLDNDTNATHRQPDRETTPTNHRSDSPNRNDDEEPTGTSWTDHENGRRDDQKLSDGTETIVPDVSDSESDEMIVDKSSPRGGKYNLRPNATPNFTDEYRY